MLSERFEVAAGSVTGKEHLLSRRPNQDAYHLLQCPDLWVGVVCDGCGDPASPHSGVGAQLGARWMTAALAACWESAEPTADPTPLLEQSRRRVLAVMERLADTLVCETPPPIETLPGRVAAIRDYFLFTVVGFVLTPARTHFFSLGDGTLIVNEASIPLGPFPDNAPPYMAYALVETSLVRVQPELLRFRVHRSVPTSELTSFLIGSDGALEIDARGADPLPNAKGTVGPLAQFWRDDAFYANPQSVTRKLALMNTDAQSVDWEARRVRKRSGLLRDDTTLIAGRERAR